jgi:long-chain fatty acid transport protein
MGGERGHAATNHISAIYYNPAGLAFDHGTRGTVEGLFAYRSVDFTRDAGAIDEDTTAGSTPADAIGAQSGKATLRNTLISPFIAIASDLGVEGLGVGVAFYAPFGGQAKWDKNDAFAGNAMYPGAEDGTQRWSSIEAAQRSLYVTLGGAYRVNDKVGFGAGLNVVSSSIDLVRARNLDGTDHVVDTAGNIKEGRSLIEAKGLDLAFSAGVIVKPTPCSRIGLSYQSQPNFGEMSLEGTLTNKFGTGAVQPAADIEVRQALPDVVRLAGEWRGMTKASLHGAIDYQRWSKYKNTCIMNAGTPGDCQVNPDGTGGAGLLVNVARNWQDTVTVRGGGRYFVSDTFEVNGGLTYDSSAVPTQEGAEYTSMEPSLFDMTKVIGQLGTVYTTGNLELSATLGYIYYSTVTTAPAAPLESPSRNPDMAGTYSQFIGYALIGVGGRL